MSLTPEQAKSYLKQLREFNADPMQQLARLDLIYNKSMDGFQNEKATAKGDVVVVTEVFPGIAVQAIRTSWGIVKDLYRIAAEGSPEERDYQFELHVITKPQEVTGDTD